MNLEIVFIANVYLVIRIKELVAEGWKNIDKIKFIPSVCHKF